MLHLFDAFIKFLFLFNETSITNLGTQRNDYWRTCLSGRQAALLPIKKIKLNR